MSAFDRISRQHGDRRPDFIKRDPATPEPKVNPPDPKAAESWNAAPKCVVCLDLGWRPHQPDAKFIPTFTLCLSCGNPNKKPMPGYDFR